MASKVKRGKYYSVVYNYTNEKGEEQQKWESNKYTSKQADERIKEIEWDLKNGSFIVPSEMTVRQLFEKVVAVYGANNWQPGTYESNVGLIENHINPHIGERPIQKVMPLEIEEMFNKLKKEKVQRGKGKDRPLLSSTTLSLIYTVLKQGFDLGVKWKMLKENPVAMDKPKRSTKEASIWEKDTFYYALADMKHPQLHLAVHLAFACTLRIGETVGLTWECVDFDKNKIHIRKTLQRVQKTTLEVVSKEDIYLEFPNVLEDKKSTLILKKPKTKSSIRTIDMTGPVRHELLMRKQLVAKQKAFHGKEYQDYDLVFCMDDGRPVEPHLCEKWFNKWQKRTEGEFPRLKFHEIRHSSATYKMDLANGNPRQVADHSGHAKLDVLFGTYVHSKKDSGRELSEKFERDFYSTGGAVQIAAKKEEDAKDTLLKMLREDPSLRDVVREALDASNAEDANNARLAKN